VIECAVFPGASSVTETTKETKYGIKVAWGENDAQNVEHTRRAEKARDTTFGDEKYGVHHSLHGSAELL